VIAEKDIEKVRAIVESYSARSEKVADFGDWIPNRIIPLCIQLHRGIFRARLMIMVINIPARCGGERRRPFAGAISQPTV
jgi:hypothetical protein